MPLTKRWSSSSTKNGHFSSTITMRTLFAEAMGKSGRKIIIVEIWFHNVYKFIGCLSTKIPIYMSYCIK